MKIRIIRTAGIKEAIFGMSLAHKDRRDINWILNSESKREDTVSNQICSITPKNVKTAMELASMDGGHNKFLESIQCWILIEAPRHWWQEFDTYRIGISKQSTSTMHTLSKRMVDYDDFNMNISSEMLNELNKYLPNKSLWDAKNNLPESFLQVRMVNLNYKCLRNIMIQRKNHKHPGWIQFVKYISLELPSFNLLGLK